MRRILFSVAIILLTVGAGAQGRWYLNGGFGPMNYVGDLQDKQLTAQQALFSGFGGLTYQPSTHFEANLAFSFGAVKADDSDNGSKWVYRNLSFRSDIMEIAATAQYNMFGIDWPGEDRSGNRITPYLFAGIGMVHFNPYTHDQSGKKVYLQPLGTEGQTTPYSLWAVSIPMGIGFKYSLTDKFMLSGEFNLRKTLTDYMDDVSQHAYPDSMQLLATHGAEAVALSYRANEIPNSPYIKQNGYRGNPNKKDGFYTITIKISYQIFASPKFYYGY